LSKEVFMRLLSVDKVWVRENMSFVMFYNFINNLFFQDEYFQYRLIVVSH